MRRDPPLDKRCQTSAKRAHHAPTLPIVTEADAQNMVWITQKNRTTFRGGKHRKNGFVAH
jgi:hypothetical protein